MTRPDGPMNCGAVLAGPLRTQTGPLPMVANMVIKFCPPYRGHLRADVAHARTSTGGPTRPAKPCCVGAFHCNDHAQAHACHEYPSLGIHSSAARRKLRRGCSS